MFLLSLVYDSTHDRSYVGTIDALASENGFVGKAWFDQPIPFTFHGGFVSDRRR
jgi:carotenoid cleavage dioxygenase-like enzyme